MTYKILQSDTISKQECEEEAIIHFEQVIKHNQAFKANVYKRTREISEQNQHAIKSNASLSAEALFQIILIHISTRDFYQA